MKAIEKQIAQMFSMSSNQQAVGLDPMSSGSSCPKFEPAKLKENKRNEIEIYVWNVRWLRAGMLCFVPLLPVLLPESVPGSDSEEPRYLSVSRSTGASTRCTVRTIRRWLQLHC